MELPREIIYNIILNYIPCHKTRLQSHYHKNIINDIKFIAYEDPIKWFWKQPKLFIINKNMLGATQNVYDYLLRSKNIVF